MKKMNYVAKLKQDIQTLEEEQSVKWQQLKEQLFLTYNGFRPAKIIQSTLKDMVTSPYVIDNIIDTTLGIATGFISKKIVVSASRNIFRRVLGTVVQAGTTRFVFRNAGTIKAAGLIALRQMFRKKQKPEKP